MHCEFLTSRLYPLECLAFDWLEMEIRRLAASLVKLVSVLLSLSSSFMALSLASPDANFNDYRRNLLANGLGITPPMGFVLSLSVFLLFTVCLQIISKLYFFIRKVVLFSLKLNL